MKEEHIERVLYQTHLRARRSREQVKTHSNFDPISSEVYERIFRKLIRQGDVIMNVGPGFSVGNTLEGSFLNESLWDATKNRGAHLVVADMSHDDLLSHKDLREVTGDDHVSIVEANGTKLPLPDNSLSGIASSNLINCPNEGMSLRDQAISLIREFYRTLRPGGFLLLSSFGYFYLGRDERGDVFNDGLREKDILYLRDIERILQKEGFVNIADLELDEDRMAFLAQEAPIYARNRDAGGFLAYKNK